MDDALYPFSLPSHLLDSLPERLRDENAIDMNATEFIDLIARHFDITHHDAALLTVPVLRTLPTDDPSTFFSRLFHAIVNGLASFEHLTVTVLYDGAVTSTHTGPSWIAAVQANEVVEALQSTGRDPELIELQAAPANQDR